MKLKITNLILALVPLFCFVGCGSKKSDDSAQKAQQMTQLAQAQSSSNVKCSAQASCVEQCQKNYQTNPSMLQICLNSTTPKQGKPTLDTTGMALVEICDGNNICALTAIDRIEACYQTGDCATVPTAKE